jgi:hypothetical protein
MIILHPFVMFAFVVRHLQLGMPLGCRAAGNCREQFGQADDTIAANSFCDSITE